MDAKAPCGALRFFSPMNDPRKKRGIRHRLPDMIAIAITAVICNADGWEDIEIFGKCKAEWFATFLDLPHGVPSHDTFARVFAKLDPDDMSSVEKFAARMTEKIEAEFPLRGLVSESKGDGTMVLNVGSRQGVTAGLLMKVIADGDPVTVRGKVVGRAAEEISFLEVTSVDKDFSFGKVLKTSRAVEEGMKVEEAKSIKG